MQFRIGKVITNSTPGSLTPAKEVTAGGPEPAAALPLPHDSVASGQPNYGVRYQFSLQNSPIQQSEPKAAVPILPPTVAESVKPLTIQPYSGPSILEQLSAQCSLDGLSKIRLQLKEVEFYQAQYAALKTPAQFQAETKVLQGLVREGASLEQLRPRAYALARCAATVALKGKTPFDSQVLGGLAMRGGQIAEMKTGEGKTLAALMPLFLHALSGKGSDLITVNDFLAKEGFSELKPALEMLGMSVGLVLSDQTPEEKKRAYNSDVTYVSNDTFGFDYLRDRTCYHSSQRVHRMPGFALIDEVDQVLLDEARVPLIISSSGMTEADYQELLVEGPRFRQIVKELEPNKDIQVDRRERVVTLSERGMEAVANELALNLALELPSSPEREAKCAAGLKLRSLIRRQHEASENKLDADLQKDLKEQIQLERQTLPPLDPYEAQQNFRVLYLQTALEAEALFRKGKDYLVLDGKVQLVDEFKGRVSDGRRLSHGLHQALEIKEGLKPDIRSGGRVSATITYPNLFHQIPLVAGMTGTAQEAKEEFKEVLGLQVVPIPPRLTSQRIDLPDRVYATKQEKLAYITQRTQASVGEGIPILDVSPTVEENKQLAASLASSGTGMQVLDAQDVKTNTPEENAAISLAGKSGAATAATTMAGRGVDIKPDSVNYKNMAIACDEARLRGQTVLALVETTEQAQRLQWWFGEGSDIPHTLWTPEIPLTEGAINIGVLPKADWAGQSAPCQLTSADFPGKVLRVVGNGRSIDPRIDEQLKGRAGRQGAPGETEFVLSLDDDLLKLYSNLSKDELKEEFDRGGAERIAEIAQQSQKRASDAQAGLRLASFRFDKTVNLQREMVWKFRDQWVDRCPSPESPSGVAIAGAPSIDQTVADFAVQAYQEFVYQGLQSRPANLEVLKELTQQAEQTFGIGVEIAAAKGWQESLEAQVRSKISHLEQHLSQNRPANVPAEAVSAAQWRHVLRALDSGWTEQLQRLDEEKQSCQLDGFIGKEPEQAFLERCNDTFVQMWSYVKRSATESILKEMLRAFQVTGGDPATL